MQLGVELFPKQSAPAGQDEQVAELVAPVFDEYFPAGQDEQDELPLYDEYFPAEQDEHDELPLDEYFPAEQYEQV